MSVTRVLYPNQSDIGAVEPIYNSLFWASIFRLMNYGINFSIMEFRVVLESFYVDDH